ncbi:hypothetical protein [uncultured Chitinophaga sp.]|jgi:hypothetical protein|uniref:hypothetical protein n=1 Tax=uncultured Chitinophaga sp. TaxID=339340 RepID=UPI00261BDA94|nr:hypothetical protein [uncultured Chitinophaga sp.]
MYSFLLFTHSLWRWLVLISLVYAIIRGVRGRIKRLPFTATDNRARHFTATIAHIQLIIGYALYFNSPVISYFRTNFKTAVHQPEFLFFGLIHIIGMTTSIVLITVGSSMAKRQATDREKFNVMAFWFILALIMIFVTIPWPFSPLAHRPYLRHF